MCSICYISKARISPRVLPLLKKYIAVYCGYVRNVEISEIFILPLLRKRIVAVQKMVLDIPQRFLGPLSHKSKELLQVWNYFDY